MWLVSERDSEIGLVAGKQQASFLPLQSNFRLVKQVITPFKEGEKTKIL